MAKRWHINKDGIPARCSARQKPCPLSGDDEHFETKKEAIEFIDNQNSLIEKYDKGLIPSNEFYDNLSMTYLSHMLGINKTKIRSEMTEYEAIKSQLNNLRDDGLDYNTYFFKDNNISTEKKTEMLQIAEQACPNIKGENNFYGVFENDAFYTIWANSNDELDIVYLDKKTNKIAKSEVKNLESGAQFSSKSIKENNINFHLKEVEDQVENYDSLDLDNLYGNTFLDLTNKQASEYLVKEYREKGATRFSFKRSNGKIDEIHLTNRGQDITDRAIEKINQNYNIRVTMRPNVKDGDKHFDKNRDLEEFEKKYPVFFKDGKAKTEFELNDLKVERRRNTIKNPKDHYVLQRPSMSQKQEDEFKKEMSSIFLNKPSKDKYKEYYECDSLRIGDYYFDKKYAVELESGKKVFPKPLKMEYFKKYKVCITGDIKEKESF